MAGSRVYCQAIPLSSRRPRRTARARGIGIVATAAPRAGREEGLAAGGGWGRRTGDLDSATTASERVGAAAQRLYFSPDYWAAKRRRDGATRCSRAVMSGERLDTAEQFRNAAQRLVTPQRPRSGPPDPTANPRVRRLTTGMPLAAAGDQIQGTFNGKINGKSIKDVHLAYLNTAIV